MYREVIVPWSDLLWSIVLWSDCIVKRLYSEVTVLWRIVLWSDCLPFFATV